MSKRKCASTAEWSREETTLAMERIVPAIAEDEGIDAGAEKRGDLVSESAHGACPSGCSGVGGFRPRM
ncbi:hypothetical protein D3C71_2158370 [compost metagenome]